MILTRGIYLEKKNNKLYPRLEIQTISNILAEQLLELFKKLKFRATKHSWIDRFNIDRFNINKKIVYVISIRGDEMFIKFMDEIGPKNPKHLEKYKNFLRHKPYKGFNFLNTMSL